MPGAILAIAMNLNPRQHALLEHVRNAGSATVDALARQFDVTQQTIRRDVLAMEEGGLLARFHGGVRLPGGAENLAYAKRKTLLSEEKQAIAALLARHIPDRSSIFLNLGTTTEAVAQALHRHQGLRVVTNNLNVAALMCDFPDAEVVVAGGVVRPRDRGITGEQTIEVVRQYNVDFAVIGVSSIDLDGTLREFDHREVRVTQAIMAQSRHVMLVADHSKFGRPALVRLGHLRDIDSLFTDQPLPQPLAARLAGGKPVVHIAAGAPPTR